MTFARLVKVSRPRFWIYLLGPVLVAFAASGLQFSPVFILLVPYATLPANLMIYGVNDIFDRDTDALNVKKSGYERELEDASVAYLVFWIIILNLPFLALLIWLLPVAALPWLGLFILTGIGYSVPPIRAKTKPFLDAVFNILYVCLGFAGFVLLTGHQPAWFVIVAAGCWCAAMHAYSAVPDIKADKGAGLSTIATVLGDKMTLIICASLYAASTILAFSAIGIFALLAGAAYVFVMLISVRALRSGTIFSIYRFFPLLNTIVGMGLWFVIVLSSH